jgi:hypothetical protein
MMMKMMKVGVVLAALAGVAEFGASAHESNVLLRFDGGIGVIPVQGVVQPANLDGTFANVTRNIVRGVNPGAGPWRIGDLRAVIFEDGRIRVRGRGLLLASTDKIGQNANQSVFATLICEATGPFVQHNTNIAGVPLGADGDFTINDTLSQPPTECASPVLLIRNTAGVWFAAGIQKLHDDDDNN